MSYPPLMLPLGALQIPHMHVSVAAAVMRRYPSLRSLLSAYGKLVSALLLALLQIICRRWL